MRSITLPSPNREGALTKDNEGDAGRWRDLAGTGPSWGRRFFERLLLSLIDAQPNPHVENLPDHVFHDRETRLRAAMDALFNERVSYELSDHSALIWKAPQLVCAQVNCFALAKLPAGGSKPQSDRPHARATS